jgi:hypothetical protein
MDLQRVLKHLEELSPDQQSEVADFVEFLRRRVGGRPKRITRTALQKEAFVGMWKDRADIRSGRTWVRALRKREWGGAHGPDSPG